MPSGAAINPSGFQPPAYAPPPMAQATASGHWDGGASYSVGGGGGYVAGGAGVGYGGAAVAAGGGGEWNATPSYGDADGQVPAEGFKILNALNVKGFNYLAKLKQISAPVKTLWGCLQWYDISNESIPSEFWEIRHFYMCFWTIDFQPNA